MQQLQKSGHFANVCRFENSKSDTGRTYRRQRGVLAGDRPYPVRQRHSLRRLLQSNTIDGGTTNRIHY